MPDPSPTMEELAANMAALQRQMDMASLAPLTGVLEVLNRNAVTKAITDIQALIPQLPESIELRAPRNQANNVVSVLNNVRSLFDSEVARVQALPPPEAEA